MRISFESSIILNFGLKVALAIGGLPGFRIDRTGAAIIGASRMVGFNVLTVDEAIQAVDHSTLLLLLGMMVVVAARAVEHDHRPKTLLAAIVAVAGVFSAFFVNDTMCLMLTPLVLEVATALGRKIPCPTCRRLTAQQERFRNRSLAANFERAEVLVPIAFRYLRFRLDPEGTFPVKLTSRRHYRISPLLGPNTSRPSPGFAPPAHSTLSCVRWMMNAKFEKK